jgi:hypothetical protein
LQPLGLDRLEDLLRGPEFHNFAVVHEHHGIRGRAHETYLVGNYLCRHAVGTKICDEFQDALDGVGVGVLLVGGSGSTRRHQVRR